MSAASEIAQSSVAAFRLRGSATRLHAERRNRLLGSVKYRFGVWADVWHAELAVQQPYKCRQGNWAGWQMHSGDVPTTRGFAAVDVHVGKWNVRTRSWVIVVAHDVASGVRDLVDVLIREYVP
jgi:hypothetical protein